MKPISLAEIKQAIKADNIDKLSGLTRAVARFLKSEIDQEEVVREFSEEDISEEDLQALYGEETQELIAKIVIEQVDYSLAAWILKQLITSDFVKEEIAFAFTKEYSLSDDEVGELSFALYTQDFLTPKEKTSLIAKASQKTLLSLAIFYSEEPKVLDYVSKLDKLNLSLWIQSNEVKHISPEVYEFLQSGNQLYGKSALSALSKCYFLSPAQIQSLVGQILSDDDNDLAYFILTQVDIDSNELRQKAIKSAINSFYFTWQSLPTRIIQEVEEFVILRSLYEFSATEAMKKISFQGRDLASFNLKTRELSYNKYFTPEVINQIKQVLTQVEAELPPVIKGWYNLFEEKFYAQDPTIQVANSQIQSIDYGKSDHRHNALKLWKPNLKINATLELKNKKYIMYLHPEENALITPWSAKNLDDLRQQIKNRIEALTQSLKLAPMNPSRAFGVEIELCMKGVRPSDLALTLEAQDLYETNELPQVNSSKKTAISSWAIKSDESVKHVDKNNKPLKEMAHLSGNMFTAEIITPKLYGEEGLEEIRNKLTTMLQEYGDCLSVNFTCGLHVHHDMNQFFIHNAKTNQYELPDAFEQMIKEEFAKVQESIYSLCADHRRDNIYCPRFDVENKVKTPVLKYDEDEASENPSMPRPRPGFNLGTGYGTLEYRMHEATLDIEQIINWVRITHHLFDEIINKSISVKNQAVSQLEETLKLMEIEKLKKIESEDDLQVALAEINDFITNNAWAKVLIQT